MVEKIMLENSQKCFENLRKLADKNNGYVESVLYDIEIDEILKALDIAIASVYFKEMEDVLPKYIGVQLNKINT